MPIPSVIEHAEFVEALKPLMSLIGIDVMAVYAEGFHVTSESIEGILVERPEGAAVEDAVATGDELGWPFTVAVNL